MRGALAAAAGSARVSLWIRALDGSSGQELVGTEGATAPFWSPDSRFIAFTVGGKLKQIAATGGTPVDIADAPLEGDGRGSPGTWNSDDVIGPPGGGVRSFYDVSRDGLTLPAQRRGGASGRHANHARHQLAGAAEEGQVKRSWR